MEFGFDQETWRQPAGFAGSLGPGMGTRPQRHQAQWQDARWHGLRSRLDAAYAARLALVAGQFARLGRVDGSFDRGSARIVAGYVPAAGVNLTDSNIGKPAGDNCSAVAGAKTAGDRG